MEAWSYRVHGDGIFESIIQVTCFKASCVSYLVIAVHGPWHYAASREEKEAFFNTRG